MRIREIVAAKPSQGVVTVAPQATVRELLALLAENNVGALVVSNDGRSVDGIVSERDVVRRLHENPDVLSAEVSTIMTASVHTCDPDSDLDEMMGVMTERRIRHVPVVSGGSLVGIVSIGDVVKHKISSLQFERDQLDSYVHQT
ncbi:CBS domain-containing protein [Nocardioides marmoribigeumensis]|uniref:CBS domain-containing protein n=1 Tax=Nocardioides marmoribigeumensis TaxID=433649 RepID=A0ABU2BYT4_9ACTN|nr:CBS domain-containing protein [Nocardioides marmoribigeumensis]MDR7363559.1 CBS domain-containing protein [Nocardioides marmoribigeumensis]